MTETPEVPLDEPLDSPLEVKIVEKKTLHYTDSDLDEDLISLTEEEKFA